MAVKKRGGFGGNCLRGYGRVTLLLKRRRIIAIEHCQLRWLNGGASADAGSVMFQFTAQRRHYYRRQQGRFVAGSFGHAGAECCPRKMARLSIIQS